MVLQEIPPAFEDQTPGVTARAPLPPNENRIQCAWDMASG